MNSSTGQQGDYIVHGMMCSYFTKKLEAYLLVKGIPYQFVEMDSPDLVHCGDQVGVKRVGTSWLPVYSERFRAR